MKTVKFENGVLSTDDEEVIEFCEKYNSGGKLSSGRVLARNTFPIISATAPGASKTVEKIVEKTVEKKVIPASMLEMLELENVIDIAAKEFGLSLVDAKDKKDAIKIMKESGFVS